jgi:hypothetical protein
MAERKGRAKPAPLYDEIGQMTKAGIALDRRMAEFAHAVFKRYGADTRRCFDAERIMLRSMLFEATLTRLHAQARTPRKRAGGEERCKHSRPRRRQAAGGGREAT